MKITKKKMMVKMKKKEMIIMLSHNAVIYKARYMEHMTSTTVCGIFMFNYFNYFSPSASDRSSVTATAAMKTMTLIIINIPKV